MAFVDPGFTDVGYLGGRAILAPGEQDELVGILDLARGLVTQDIGLPEQQLAGFTPDQELAFALARQGIGSWKPFLERAEGLTEQGVATLEEALSGTKALAGQIPGEIRPGQEALTQAAQDVQAAARRGESISERAALGAEEAARYGLTGAEIAAERARGSTAEAQRALQEASAFGLESARAGIAGLAPEVALSYMSPYEEAAVQQALRDIAREGELQQQAVRAKAVESGAFGGSRQAVAEQELARNILEQQARTAAQMRGAGFESAANRAIQAAQTTGQLGQIGAGAAAGAAEAGGRLGLSAEQLAQASALQGGQLGLQGAQTAGQLGMQGAQMSMQGAQAAGDLGLQSANLGLAGIQAGLGAQQQAAGLGQGIAGLGQQMVGLGQAGQQMNLQDVNTMLGIGGQQQRQAQGLLDVAYQNQYQQAMQPYQQLAYYSDIAQGTPSGQSSVTTQPGPSTGSQLLGAAMAIPAIYSGFQSMTG